MPRNPIARRIASVFSAVETLGVGVLDAQDERATVVPRERPVVDRGARPADMQVAGGTRCETDANGVCHSAVLLGARVTNEEGYSAVSSSQACESIAAWYLTAEAFWASRWTRRPTHSARLDVTVVHALARVRNGARVGSAHREAAGSQGCSGSRDEPCDAPATDVENDAKVLLLGRLIRPGR